MTALVDAALGGARFAMQLLSGFALGRPAHGRARHLRRGGLRGQPAHARGRHPHGAGRARRRTCWRLVLRQGMVPVLVGLAVGLAVALALGRLGSSLLFEVPPHDPATLARGGAPS